MARQIAGLIAADHHRIRQPLAHAPAQLAEVPARQELERVVADAVAAELGVDLDAGSLSPGEGRRAAALQREFVVPTGTDPGKE